MKLSVPEWFAVGRFERAAPVSVPAAAVMTGRGTCAEQHSRSPWLCTRRAGHTGRHTAAIGTGEVLAVWP